MKNLSAIPGWASLSRRFFAPILGLTLAAWPTTGRSEATTSGELIQSDVFVRGEEGYFAFRIPAIVRANDGTLLAFAEARRDSIKDHGKIDLVLKRSQDNGTTWGPLQRIHGEGEETIGNPCPVVDRKTGKIWLPFCRNNRQVFVSVSDDSGASWAAPREITSSVKKPAWKWYATGPGIGIQLRSGRLVIPCNHGDKAVTGHTAHVIFSDDGGKTWELGGAVRRRSASISEATDEAQVAELPDGRLLMNMRTDRSEPRRAISHSRDAGKSWSTIQWSEELREPFACQASLLSYPNPQAGGPDLLLFSNPKHPKQRRNLTLRVSEDGGETWPVQRSLFKGFGGYSCLLALPDGMVGVLTERDRKVQRIVFYRFPLSWLYEENSEFSKNIQEGDNPPDEK